MQELQEKVIEKFWSNVEKTDECWNWKGKTDKSGSPIVRVHPLKSAVYVRRLSLQLDGKTVLSSEPVLIVCKNKLCVNPAHLVSGNEGRFWPKILKLSEENGGCWVWTAGQDKDMYGKFTVRKDGKRIDIRAHQYSWELFTGRPVPKGILVCHTCDHPYCVNPSHLFLGTAKDNNKDAMQKGRSAIGEKHGRSKLTVQKVKEIRSLYSSGQTKTQLSHLYEISRQNIYDIVNGNIWKEDK